MAKKETEKKEKTTVEEKVEKNTKKEVKKDTKKNVHEVVIKIDGEAWSSKRYL